MATTLIGDIAADRATLRSHWWNAFVGAWIADFQARKRDWRVVVVLGLGLLMAVIAAFTTAMDTRATIAERKAAQAAENARWQSQGKKNAHSAAHYGVYVFKPLSPLAAVEPGVERYVGSTVWLEAHKQNEFNYRPANDLSGASRQLPLTPSFVLQVIAPLAIIFLGFAVFAGERERGTLRALRMTAAPLSAIACARALMLLALACALALPGGVAVAFTSMLYVGVSPSVDGMVRMMVMLGAYGVYLASWAALVVAVSAFASTLRIALAILFATWALSTLILPRVAAELSTQAHPLPSLQAFRAQLDKALGEPHDPAEEAKEKAAIMAQFGVTDVKQLPVNWAGISLQRGENKGNAIFDAQYGALFKQMNAQSDTINLFAWASPTIAVNGLSSAAAASDTAHHLRFIQDTEAHRRYIQRTLNDFIRLNPDKDGAVVQGDDGLWASILNFDYQFPSLLNGQQNGRQHVALGAAQSAAALLFFAVVATALLMAAMRRLTREVLR